MTLFRIEHDMSLEDVIDVFREVLEDDFQLQLELVDESDGWLEFGVRHARDEDAEV